MTTAPTSRDPLLAAQAALSRLAPERAASRPAPAVAAPREASENAGVKPALSSLAGAANRATETALNIRREAPRAGARMDAPPRPGSLVDVRV